jgi:predicted transposase YbfD/YdcC
VYALVGSHWESENSAHWVLSIVVHRDASRIRMDNTPRSTSMGAPWIEHGQHEAQT